MQATCDEGRAVISTSGTGCPQKYVGRFQTAWCARASHNHDICTAAKNKAREKLRSDRKIPAACNAYVTSTQPCRVIQNCPPVRACWMPTRFAFFTAWIVARSRLVCHFRTHLFYKWRQLNNNYYFPAPPPCTSAPVLFTFLGRRLFTEPTNSPQPCKYSIQPK